MVSLVIYGIIAITLASAAGYALLTFTDTSKQATSAQENIARMEVAASAVRASLMPLASGTAFAPMGHTVNDGQGHSYTGLPSLLGVVGTTPWGQPYLYCPVSLTSASGLAADALNTVNATTVQMPSGATYAVSVYSGAATNSVPGSTADGAYVIASPTNPVANVADTDPTRSYVAFIVSSTGPGMVPPDCSKIAISTASNKDGGVTVPNGYVRGVTASLPFAARNVASTQRMEIYVSNNTTSGDSTGRDANNPTTLQYALQLWQSLQPRQTDIYLAGGVAYALSSDLDATNASEFPGTLAGRAYADGDDTALTIATMPGASAQAILSITGPTSINTRTTFENLNIELTPVNQSAPPTSLAMTVTRPLTMNDVTYSGVLAVVGAVSTYTPINVYGTTMTVNDSSFDNIAITVNNGSLQFYNRTAGSPSNPSFAQPTFNTTTINGSSASVSFDGAGATSYVLAGVANQAPLTLNASTLNIGPGVTLNSFNANPSIWLYNSSLNVSGNLNLSGGSQLGAITVFDGSDVLVSAGGAVTATANSGQMNYGIYLLGSNLGLEGTLTTTGLAYGAVGVQQGALTGRGSIKVGQPNVYPCLRMVTAAAGPVYTAAGAVLASGSASISIPLYLNATAVAADTLNNYYNTAYASFAQAQNGNPPVMAYLNSPVSAYQEPTAAQLSSTNNPINDPEVNVTFQPPLGSVQAYLDRPTFERGVRNVVNAELVSGTSINFQGSCAS